MCKSICLCVLVCVSIGGKCVFDYRAKPRHRVLAKAAESLATNLIDSSKRAATIIPIRQRNITTPNVNMGWDRIWAIMYKSYFKGHYSY